MDITPVCVVALTWTLKDTLGEVLDELQDPVEFMVGGHDLLPRIEEALQGYSPGAALDLHLEPEEAFGDFDEQLLFLAPRAAFAPEMDVGMVIEGHALPPGLDAAMPKELFYTVSEIYPEHLVLDANHPLAGIALRLHLRVHGVREATPDERERGSCGAGFFRVAEPPQPGDATLH